MYNDNNVSHISREFLKKENDLMRMIIKSFITVRLKSHQLFNVVIIFIIKVEVESINSYIHSLIDDL